jgi:chromosome segregation ATPase
MDEAIGYIKQAMERLLAQLEEIKRRQEALEALTQRIMAEQEELRRRQDAQSQEWVEFGRRWSAYSAAWETRLQSQVQQFEGFTQELGAFTRQLTAWEARLNGQLQVLDALTQQFTDLLPPEEY